MAKGKAWTTDEKDILDLWHSEHPRDTTVTPELKSCLPMRTEKAIYIRLYRLVNPISRISSNDKLARALIAAILPVLAEYVPDVTALIKENAELKALLVGLKDVRAAVEKYQKI